ncbi:MAG: putative sugar nucleotidyl transferase [Planctomycetota bacterium]|nr:putative sugar nucleotidyl transferase [Planctomycetota bacterium]
MRLILIEPSAAKRADFEPLSLSRPIWQLRCGMTSLGEKLIAKLRPAETACFVEPYMAAFLAESLTMKVNDPATLAGADLLLVNGRVKVTGFDVAPTGAGEIGVGDDGEVMYARLSKAEADKCKADTLEAFLAVAKKIVPVKTVNLPVWNYTWDLVLQCGEEITREFKARGRSGVEGTLEQPSAIRGDPKNVYIAPGAKIHPMVVIDAEHGPVYLDEKVTVHPFTRIEGPCFIGAGSILLGAKCREGNSIGPMCRIGGEVEESIVHGHSNKYHDGFLGHAYVGEWVNLGALTTNSDLKNDYSSVSVIMDGKRTVDTGSTKVGSLIGDHTKTSVGVLLNTGSYVGAMALIMATGQPLQKFLPSFAWLIDGHVTKGFGRKQLYATAAIAKSRRGAKWTPAEEAMWEAIFQLTAEPRDAAIQKGRKAMLRK